MKIITVEEDIINFLSQIENTIENTIDEVGGVVIFEGRVRRDLDVHSIEYQGDKEMIFVQGEMILKEAIEKFQIIDAILIHRLGYVKVGELSIWIRCSAKHRKEAYASSQFIIDNVKKLLPIWKKEHLQNGESHWIM
ncbi:MAG: molybdenum cofactor biosynthesis protein MoaE [Oligoflexia bacterium]|nr:molybdenum cofactor biosynthesis protein MoaE [Oligoflexia bacterium]